MGWRFRTTSAISASEKASLVWHWLPCTIGYVGIHSRKQESKNSEKTTWSTAQTRWPWHPKRRYAEIDSSAETRNNQTRPASSWSCCKCASNEYWNAVSGAVFEMIGSVQADLFLLGGHHGEIGGRLYNPRTPISTAFLTLNLRGSTRESRNTIKYVSTRVEPRT